MYSVRLETVKLYVQYNFADFFLTWITFCESCKHSYIWLFVLEAKLESAETMWDLQNISLLG